MRNLLLSTVLLMALPLAIYAQRDSTVTVRLEDVSLREAIRDIQNNSEFQFFYNSEHPALDKKISLRLRRANIVQVLDSLLLDSELSYQILEDKLVVISTDEGFGRHEVSGRVLEEKTGEPIIGAHVSIKGTSTGTTTDLEGRFNILVPGGETILLFSYIGYEVLEIPAGGLTNMEVSLKEGAQALEEVVITALNISREKSSLGYSLTQVGSEEFNEVKQNNPINSLSGKVAGLQISSTPSGTDGSSRVVLRGVSSLSSGNRPLIVIHGIPLSGGS